MGWGIQGGGLRIKEYIIYITYLNANDPKCSADQTANSRGVLLPFLFAARAAPAILSIHCCGGVDD